MKTKIILSTTTIVIIVASIIISCNKNATENSTLEDLGVLNQRESSHVLNTYYGSCTAPEKVKMSIKFYGNNDEKVRIRTTVGNNTDAQGYQIDFLSGTGISNGKITIPNDDRSYWFVPANDDQPFRLKNLTYEIMCLCLGGDCEPQYVNNTVTCIPTTCTNCCEMTVIEGDVPHIKGGGVVLAAEVLIINGVKYLGNKNNFRAHSYTGECSQPGKKTMQIHDNDDTIIVKTKNTPNNSHIESFCFYNNENFPINNNTIIIPNDGKKYWFISFEDGVNPQKVAAGELTITCECNGGTGNCKISTSTGSWGTAYFCATDGCSGCCKMTAKLPGGGGAITTGGGLLISGNVIKFNGAFYN